MKRSTEFFDFSNSKGVTIVSYEENGPQRAIFFHEDFTSIREKGFEIPDIILKRVIRYSKTSSKLTLENGRIRINSLIQKK